MQVDFYKKFRSSFSDMASIFRQDCGYEVYLVQMIRTCGVQHERHMQSSDVYDDHLYCESSLME
jgi:hypothetical protein